MVEFLKPEQYKFIYKISFLSIVSAVYAIFNKHYLISLCPAGVFITSINYWRKPEYSWRRNLDMIYVQLALMYQIYSAYMSQYMIQYYMTMVLALSMYPLSIYYYKKNLHWHSTYAHSGLHIIANIANIILYSGEIL
jgi:hypothetical protein